MIRPAFGAGPWRQATWILAVALVTATVCWWSYRFPPHSISDFDQLIIAARALARGRDPYAAVVEWGHPYPLLYPLPAALVALPLAWLPLELARAVWSGIGGGCLALAALRYRRGLGVALLSASFGNAVALGQWSPLLTAAAVLPALGGLWIAKPSIGAAFFAAYPGRAAFVGAAGLLAVSTAVMPSWPLAWFDALDSTIAVSPVLRPGGPLLLLAALRLRQPEGRLFLALALVPQTTGIYETLPLFLIPRTRGEAYVLAVAGYIGAFGSGLLVPRTPGMSLPELLLARWPFVLVCFYLPALFILLRHPRVGVTTGEGTGSSNRG